MTFNREISSDQFKQVFPGYLKAPDNTLIYYATNFPLERKEEYFAKSPLLVFNYGLVCNNDHWKYQLPYFDKLGLPCLIHNYRNHYNSMGSEDLKTCTIKNFSEDLDCLVEFIGAPRNFMLGHSMGVNVCLEYARRFPEKLCGMALISGSVISPKDIMMNSNFMSMVFPAAEKLANKYPDIAKKIWETTAFNPLVRYFIRRGGFNMKQVDDQFIQVYLNRIGQLGYRVFFQLFNQMCDHDIINVLEDIKTPTLIMGGDLDQVIPNYVQQVFLNKMPNTEYYLIKDGSHVPQVDFPQSVNERIELFLEKIG